MLKTILLIFALVSSPLAFAQDDAEFEILPNDAIRIRTNIILYGEGATFAKAKEIQSAILQFWATDPSGKTWTSLDPASGRTFNVQFQVDVSLYKNREKELPKLIPETWNPFNRNNYIRIVDDPLSTSAVAGGDEGHWQGDEDPKVYAHEFGHLLGLDDRYHKVNGYAESDEGWDSNLMASILNGKVEQRNIDAVVGKILKQSFSRPTKHGALNIWNPYL